MQNKVRIWWMQRTGSEQSSDARKWKPEVQVRFDLVLASVGGQEAADHTIIITHFKCRFFTR